MLAAKETKILELEEELKSIRQMIHDGDYSNLVKSLEDEVARLKRDEQSYEEAFIEIENMSEEMQKKVKDIKQLEAAVQSLNEQLDETNTGYIKKEQELLELQEELEILKADSKRTLVDKKRDSKQLFTSDPHDKSELAYWLYEKINDDTDGGKSEVIRKFIKLAHENSQYEMRISDLENHLVDQSNYSTTYEAIKPTPSISSNKNRRKTKTGSAGSYSLISVSRQKSDRESIQSDASGLRSTPSRHSGHLIRSSTPNLPPPGGPPHNPLPPVPALPYIPNNNSTCPLPLAQQQYMASNSSFASHPPPSIASTDHSHHKARTQIPENDFKTAIEVINRLEGQLEHFQTKFQEQQHEIEHLLDEQAALQTIKNQMNMATLELKNERALKLKAEKAHYILEKRMEELMNTKKNNKFRCF
jgi:chromosome segregation ATPase